MKAQFNVAFEIEWRSRAQRAWVPTIACDKHTRMLMSRVPVRFPSDRPTHPIEECVVCKAEKANKQRRLTEGRCESSPLSDGFPASRVNAYLNKAS
jgi:hypothetical protein